MAEEKWKQICSKEFSLNSGVGIGGLLFEEPYENFRNPEFRAGSETGTKASDQPPASEGGDRIREAGLRCVVDHDAP